MKQHSLYLLALGSMLVACQPQDATKSASTAAAVAPNTPQIATTPDGVHIEYRVRGSGEPTIVLVHGWSCDANYWREQVGPLSERYRVITLDLAGHGASGRNRRDWSMRNFGTDVATVVNAVLWPNKANQQVILVGHSMGGPVVIEAARQLPEVTLAVIGVDTYKTLGLPAAKPEEIAARVQALEADFIGRTRALVTNSFFTAKSNPAFVQQIATDMSQAPPEVAIPAIRSLNQWHASRDLSDIKVPIIALNADLGGVTDDARIRKIAPTFRSVTIAGAGHFVMLEQPARFNEILLREIAGLTARVSQ